MPDRLSLHTPILVNTIGHCAGAIIFGVLLYLFIVDWRRDPHQRSVLPCIAAALALLWNVGSLIGLATPAHGAHVADAIVAFSFSVLTLLPAVLLHISLRPKRTSLWLAGYVVSGIGVALHLGDLVTTAPRFHYAGILVVTIGFGVLTLISLIEEAASGTGEGGTGDRAGARLAAAMVLFLFAISFAHFESSHPATAWSGEAALHHAGIPLALFVLLQDYRFLLLDVFIRLLVNAVLAAVAVGAAFYASVSLTRAGWERDPFMSAVLFVTACAALIAFAFLRGRAQRWLTRAIFLRTSVDHAVGRLREVEMRAGNEREYLQQAAKSIALFLSASQFELAEGADVEAAARVVENGAAQNRRFQAWVHALAPLHFASGNSRLLLLGPRAGGRRYLSEDIRALERLTAIVCEQVERTRASEMQHLVAQAELRVLQAQINPHFLFNSLNTLYGSIERENTVARGLVTNLASLFRYALTSERSFIRLEQEMRIVRAYLDIEQLRLGPKLNAAIDVDPDVLETDIPVFSIQPLVENAVKHGVAAHPGAGFVNVVVRRAGEGVSVEVSNSGPFRKPARDSERGGIGLANVRKRLALCYGAAGEVRIDSASDCTKISFTVPATRVSNVSAGVTA